MVDGEHHELLAKRANDQHKYVAGGNKLITKLSGERPFLDGNKRTLEVGMD
jgi:hypothetical protein